MDVGRNEGAVRMPTSLGYPSWVGKGVEKEGPRDRMQQKVVPKARGMFCIPELNIITICILCMSDQLSGKTLEHMYLFHNWNLAQCPIQILLIMIIKLHKGVERMGQKRVGGKMLATL